MSDGSAFGPPPTRPPTPGEPPPPFLPPAAPSSFGPPPSGPPASVAPPPGSRVRPWWGLGDVVVGLVVVVAASFLGLIAALPFIDRAAVADGAPVPPLGIAVSLVVQQAAQLSWPLVVSRWKGLGPRLDWRLDLRPIDPLIGLGTAIMVLGLAGAISAGISALVDLADEEEASNTAILSDATDSPWLPVILVAVVVGAPLAEELFFRGLVLRAFEKRAGKVVAVVGSTVAFTLPHYTGSSLDGTLVLFGAIAAVGLVLATVTVLVGRLGPAVVAHMLFNALGAAQALGWFDQPGP